MVELPTSYWHDVNRYYGEIMSRTPEVRFGFLVGTLTQTSVWESATTPKATSTLDRARVCMLGGLLKGPVRNNLHIQPEGPTGFIDKDTGYTIAFNPRAEVISRTFNRAAYNKLPEDDELTLRGLLAYQKQHGQADKQLQELGLDTPSLEDHEMLLAELRTGAETLPFTSGS